MKKTTIRALVLGTTFLVSCIIFSITTNKVNQDMTVAMSEVFLLSVFTMGIQRLMLSMAICRRWMLLR